MRFVFAILCVSLFAGTNTRSQGPEVAPLHFTAGSVVTFHVQNRLRPEVDDTLNGMPQGTAMQVKLLDAIDSRQDRDGAPFRGTVLATIGSGKAIVHAEAEVRGKLVLLRSKSHPNGFRYELMVTSIREAGQSRSLSAFLSASLFETSAALHAPAAGSVDGTAVTP